VEGVDRTCLKLDKALYPEVSWEAEPLPAELITRPGLDE